MNASDVSTNWNAYIALLFLKARGFIVHILNRLYTKKLYMGILFKPFN